MRPRTPLLLALLLAAGCDSTGAPTDPAPLDRFTWPTGLAVHQGAGESHLLVASSNFDLRFANDDGGSLIALVPPAPADPQGSLGLVRGAERIASFAGRIALADGAACGLPGGTEALVAARSTNTLFRLAVSDAGVLTCGDGCAVGLGTARTDAFAVAVTCRDVGGAAPEASAWVGYLRGPSNASFLERHDLAAADPVPQVVAIGTGSIRTILHDAAADRLLVAMRSTDVDAELRWMDLAGGCDVSQAEAVQGGCPTGEIDVGEIVKGAEIADLALSTPLAGEPRRLYAALRIFDADLAASVGFRPGFDVDGVLAVFELGESATGGPRLTLVGQPVSIGLGVSSVAVVPRAAPGTAGPRDLVVVAATDEGMVALWDDAQGSLAVPTFPPDPRTGDPAFGRRPFGLAVAPAATPADPAASATVYVGSFDQFFVTPLTVPLHQPWNAAPETVTVGTTSQIRRIGSAR